MLKIIIFNNSKNRALKVTLFCNRRNRVLKIICFTIPRTRHLSVGWLFDDSKNGALKIARREALKNKQNIHHPKDRVTRRTDKKFSWAREKICLNIKLWIEI